jgi:hypothetical protein
MPSFTPVVRQIVVHHSKRGFLSPWRRFFGLGLHADSSIRENAGRERGLCLAGFTATHLLRAGVDINTIRAWLGHRLDRHNQYLCGK